MAELKWVTPIATAIATAESEWKRYLEKASTLFKWWRKQYPHDTELDWMFYSGRQGIYSRTDKYIWNRYQTGRTTENDGKTLWTITGKAIEKEEKGRNDLPTSRETGHLNTGNRRLTLTWYPLNRWPLALREYRRRTCSKMWRPEILNVDHSRSVFLDEWPDL